MLTLLVAVAAAAPLARTESAAVPTVITSVRVFGFDGHLTEPYDVWLADGEIVVFALPGGQPPFEPVRTVDGSGCTLLPGLVDLHVHVGSTTAVPGRIHVPSPRANLEAFLYAGVTTVLDLSAPLEDVERWNDRIASGAWSGPEIVGAGRPFGAPEGHPRTTVHAVFPSFLVSLSTTRMSWEVATAADVDAALDEQGPSPFVKLVVDSLPPGAPAISEEAAARLRERTMADGTRIVAHVGRPEDVERAAALPVDLLAHSPHTGAISLEQAGDLAAAGISVVPTLSVWDAVQRIQEGAPDVGALEREILSGPHLRDFEVVAAGKAPIPEAMAGWSRSLVDGEGVRVANIGVLRNAGVGVLVGSDSPNLGHVAGAATHRELTLLVEAGAVPNEVLRAGTYIAQVFLDPNADSGTIEPGYEADLLLVRGDPTQDITATTEIVAVWVDGRLVERTPRR